MAELTEEQARRRRALDALYPYALDEDAPGAWVRAAIDAERAQDAPEESCT